MNILKVVTTLNWVIIAAVAIIAIAEALSPGRGGGDAATRGLGQLPIMVLVVLLVLNLLPFNWTKYLSLVFVVGSALYFRFWPAWTEMQRKKQEEERYEIEASKPIFEDQQRDQIARVIRDGEVEKLKELLKTPVERLNERGDLLDFAIDWAAGANHRQAEKYECVRLLFEAGAAMDSTIGTRVTSHMAAAATGDVKLLRFLLEKGADPNAFNDNMGYPILYEAISAIREPEAIVRVLLEFGADPNATGVFDHAEGPVSMLWRAAKLERWGVCLVLLEKGADPEFKTATGKTIRALVQDSEREFPAEGFFRQKDYDRLKEVLAQSAKPKRGADPK
ncbi:MAG: ankyrin repeat domain-containing protein [Saprospiraceae bacterium]|jgi:ankyrin repeat protein|nr:ankyrin repeat domain-containing protein [Saprospiraceae bacterium]